jgi:hypothetical protein
VTPDYTADAVDLADLLAMIDAGLYRPAPNSAGEILMLAHPSTDRFTAGRELARFARLAVKRHGLWWAMALEACDECLSEAETDYMAAAWQQWCRGENPFVRGRRVFAR